MALYIDAESVIESAPMSDEQRAVLRATYALAEAWNKLNDVWAEAGTDDVATELLTESYPFRASFDDQVYDVSSWLYDAIYKVTGDERFAPED